MFQEDSASSILAVGVYVTEVCKQIETYSTLGNGFVAQHCRHIGIESIYLFLTLLNYYNYFYRIYFWNWTEEVETKSSQLES